MPSAAPAPIRRRRPRRAALPAALCLCAALGAAPRAQAATGWSVAPAGGGRPSFYAEGTPGTVLQDTVSVTNPGRAPVVVRLSGTGLRTVFAEQGGTAIRVPARTRAEVPFTVTVPAGAAPGDRSGAVVARDARGRTATVPVRLRVGGPTLAALTVEHLDVHADRITYELVNRGTTVLVPRLAVRADGILGRVLDRAPRTLPVRLRPGARLKLSESWPDRPALDAVHVCLTVTAPGGARGTATASARFVPWPAVAGTGAPLLATAAALTTARLRRRRPRPDDPPPEGTGQGAPPPGAQASDAPSADAWASATRPPDTPAPGGVPPGVPASGTCPPHTLTADGAWSGVPASGARLSGARESGTCLPDAPAPDGSSAGAPASGAPVPGGSSAGVPPSGACLSNTSAPGGPSAGALPPGARLSGPPATDGALPGVPASCVRLSDPLAPGDVSPGVPAPGACLSDPRAPGGPSAGVSGPRDVGGGGPGSGGPGGGRGVGPGGARDCDGELTEGAVK
ncbi:hypothetical protein GCM10010260_75540 [Streptomyces filipinensis]|uniref:Uncharacterized protein n=1 Tax=Streptomyces filipinensis TaxID=66887 RepID=A0A918MFY4_9ACTN|nr:hypothetical protein GCM10010260_75540 [Streptomyces filipinensis]